MLNIDKHVKDLKEQQVLKKVLLETKSILEEHGWIKGHYGHPDTGYCLDGAVSEAVISCEYIMYRAYTTDQLRRYLLIAAMAQEGHDIEYYTLVFWNDKPERTYEEVITALDCAIELAS